jgi:hypothetical protein
MLLPPPPEPPQPVRSEALRQIIITIAMYFLITNVLLDAAVIDCSGDAGEKVEKSVYNRAGPDIAGLPVQQKERQSEDRACGELV